MSDGWTWDRAHARWLGPPRPVGAPSGNQWRPVVLARRRGRWIGAASGIVVCDVDSRGEAMDAVEAWITERLR